MLLLNLAYFITIAQAATQSDFDALKSKLLDYINEQPNRRIPLLVRNSFHDMFFQDTAGIRGCLASNSFLMAAGNEGLSPTNSELKALVSKDFPNADFTFGDVIAFAGKVAVESAYPCVKVPFNFGRSACSLANPNQTRNSEVPHGFENSLESLKPTLDYTGLTAEEMAILIAGAHGIKGAQAEPSGWIGTFSHFSSGKDYIVQSFNQIWQDSKQLPLVTLPQFVTSTDLFGGLIRLPTDFLFFPSKVVGNNFKEQGATGIENTLKSFTTQPRQAFDDRFAQVYAKMLQIGFPSAQLTPFVDNSPVGTCNEPVPPPSPVTTSQVPPPPVTTSQVPPPPVTTSNVAPVTTSSSYSEKQTSTRNSPKPTNIVNSSNKLMLSSFSSILFLSFILL
jgi:hypothetical protein